MGIREIQIRDYIEQFYGVYPELRRVNNKICFIYAGALQSLSFENYTTHKLAKKINLSLARGKTKLVFLNMDETIFSRTIDKIHAVLDIINIDHCDIFYVCSGATADVEYLKYVRKYKFKKRINILALNKFERCISPLYDIDYEVKIKSKFYICKQLNKLYYEFSRKLKVHKRSRMGID
jgi:hypothetical protein